MAVNMTSLWELITEVTDHTTELVDLVILGVIIVCAYAIGGFVVSILKTGTKGAKR